MFHRAVVAAALLAGAALRVHAAEPSGMEPAACPPGIPEAIQSRVTCGTVAVPVAGGNDPARWRLFVMRIEAGRPSSERTALLLQAGGPGFAPSLGPVARLGDLVSFASDRDIVLFDERGSGRSEPKVCADLGSRTLALEAADLPADEHDRRRAALYDLCREELRRAGIPAEAFGTPRTAEDVEAIRRALGLDRLDLYGISYAGRLAADYAARHPQRVRSVLFDSTMETGGGPQRTDGFEPALSGVIRKCADDAGCARRYPDLRSTITRVLADLERNPLRVPVDAGVGLPGNEYVLNRQDLEWVLFTMLYSRPGHAAVPAFVTAVERRDPAAVAPVIERLADGMQAFSELTFVAVMCRDMQVRDAPGNAMAGYEWLQLRGVCAGWGAPGPEPRAPLPGSVPMLFLAGGNDPITPPAIAEDLARRLGAPLFRFPGMGHGVGMGHRCARRIVSAFLDRPGATVDGGCAGQPLPPLDFQ